VPERELFVARLDQTICGSAQLQRAPRNNEAQALSGNLTTSFMAPWARGHGLARMLVLAVEAAARAADLRVLNLDVWMCAKARMRPSSYMSRWDTSSGAGIRTMRGLASSG